MLYINNILNVLHGDASVCIAAFSSVWDVGLCRADRERTVAVRSFRDRHTIENRLIEGAARCSGTENGGHG